MDRKKRDPDFVSVQDIVLTLNHYYIDTRYPSDVPTFYPIDEAKKAVDGAHSICEFVRHKLKL